LYNIYDDTQYFLFYISHGVYVHQSVCHSASHSN
jgi:hypothetical protein